MTTRREGKNGVAEGEEKRSSSSDESSDRSREERETLEKKDEEEERRMRVERKGSSDVRHSSERVKESAVTKSTTLERKRERVGE